MGKVVKAIAVIAVAAAVAYFAPQLLPALIGSGTIATAVTTAIVSTAIAAAVSAGVSLLAGKPHTSTAPGRQETRGQPMEADGFGWRYPPVHEMMPVDEPWWRNALFYPWQRRAIRPVRGNCMVPVVPASARWVLVDRRARILAGDVLLIRPDDLRAYLVNAAGPARAAGLVKLFVGIDPRRRVAVFETTNPPNRIETGLDRVQHAYRVISWHPSLWAALRAYWLNQRPRTVPASSAVAPRR